MSYITFAALLLLAVGGVVSLYRQLQMLQQNSYFPSRYFKWVSGSYTMEIALSAVSYCAFMFFVLNNKDVFCLILAALILAIRIIINIKTHKKSIKKLVFTARIKRLYVTAILVLGVLLFLASSSFGNDPVIFQIGNGI